MNSTLPTWLERLLGVDTAGAGEGTIWSLDSSWPWAPWLTLLFVLFSIGFVTFVYSREGGEAGRGLKALLVGIRLALIGIVLFMIAEIALSLQRTGLPYVAVLVDTSGSMGIDDRYRDEELRSLVAQRVAQIGAEEGTRLNLAKSILLEEDGRLLREIEDSYRLRFYFVSGAAQLQSGTVDELLPTIEGAEPTGESTQLGSSVRTVLNDLRGTPPAAIVLLTDGITTDGESLGEAAQLARRKGVPLYTIALGDDQPVRDIELTDLLVDEVVFVDDIVHFEFKLEATGYQGREVEVVLRERDSPAVLTQMKVTLGPDGQPQRVRLPYRPPQVGEFEYVVEIPPLEDEAQTNNNALQRIVSVRKERIRVLLVQSYPNYEFRYLKHMLERDSTVDLRTLLQEADPEYAEQDKTALRVFPMRRDELFEFDVILFGDVDPAFISTSTMQHLNDFVQEKGGGLVFMAGPLFTPLAYRDTPLANLLPVDSSASGSPAAGDTLRDGFRVQPTELGLASPQMQLGDTPEETLQIWRQLPPLYWLYEASHLKPAARVLAEHPTRLTSDGRKLPIFCMQYVGAGKVLFHATDDTWRWRYQVGDVYFARYWVQTIRYLSRSKLLGKDRSAELTSDRREYRRGEPVRLRVRFADDRLAPAEDDGVTVVLEQQGQQKRQVTLRRNATNRGVFEGVFPKSSEGSYHAWVAVPTLEGRAPSTDFIVLAPPGEFERLQVDKAELQRAAEMTRGAFFTIRNASNLYRALPKGRQIPIEALPPLSLWNRWPLLALFLGLIVAEWLLRKRKGLL